MIIISWDVGIIHLAYCILNYIFDEINEEVTIEILDWDEINLVEEERITTVCCGKLKAKKGEEEKECGKNATYYLKIDGKIIGFCKKHLAQHTKYWSENDTKKLFNLLKKNKKETCTYSKKNGDLCGKNAKYRFKDINCRHYYCGAHYKSEMKKKIKELSPQPIKNLIIRKHPTADLQLNLVKKLDKLSEHFAKIGIEEVIIENQPSMKNPKMKAISGTLFDYFMIRGYIDKIHNMDIKLVRFMCPSNKLKVNENNTIEVFKANRNEKKKYKLTKELGIQYTKQLLKDYPVQLEYLNLYKKQDDICDAYLQGRYYLEFIRNKKEKPKKTGRKKTTVKTKKSGSKRSTKKTNHSKSSKRSTKKTKSGSKRSPKKTKSGSKRTDKKLVTKRTDKKSINKGNDIISI